MGFLSGFLGNAGSVNEDELQTEYAKLLAPDEAFEAGFRVLRDTFIFTTRRMILVDVQGLTGKKIEYLSIPYSKISKFSVETAGHFDLDAELKIWIGSDPVPLEKTFDSSTDIYAVQNVLASHC